jgi:hypothetical protein
LKILYNHLLINVILIRCNETYHVKKEDKYVGISRNTNQHKDDVI